ncbi:hypothetical protein CCY99_01755 [Helicobacter sp. 16-1353]|uniref:Opr family porin n=1 Tax=Helicobacter sp. 16-1353 TaxID=2004996 RepID=UPI000DCE681B|nr:Opr family porin [Helicobacter sp. 16-1353]RAX54894.1 hypothetical protein CCY99_01755 [Helicobacter sp. 16-1353]
MRVIFYLIFTIGILSANNFTDAITSGTKEGDIHLIFDYANSSPDKNGTKYQDNAYLATSFGLYYHSAFYGYFRAYIGFRGALPLIQGSKNSRYSGGKGDGARDFWTNSRVMLARSYLEYFDGDTNIQAGRLEQESDLIAKQMDGIWFRNKSLGFLLIDAIWINQYGRVLPRELSSFEKFNTKYGGAYYLGLTLDILEILKLKAYGLTSPQFYSFLAFKADLDTTYIDASAGIVAGFEHRNSVFRDKNSLLFNADIGFNFNIFYGELGYIKTGSSIGMGNLQLTGNSFNPFFYFSGDALNYERNVNLFYGKIGIDANIIQTYLVYGYNTFNRNQSVDSKKYSQGEINLYFDWKTSEVTNVIFYFLNTHGGKNAIPTLNQLGLAVKLGF